MATIASQQVQEVVLSIESPILAATPPGNTARIEDSPINAQRWVVAWTRIDNILSVNLKKVFSGFPTFTDQDSLVYKSLHIIPRMKRDACSSTTIDNANLRDKNGVYGIIDVDKVLHGDKYCFDVVLSVQQEPFWKSIQKPQPVLTAQPEFKSTEMMKVLLKDMHSVDTCFIFDAEKDKTRLNAGLWAHRAVLSRYEQFAKRILEDAKEKDLSDEEGSSADEIRDDLGSTVLTVPVHKFSLASFCVMLRYIYTGDIERSPDTSQHAICTTESHLVYRTFRGAKAEQESISWNPLDADSPWKLKEVDWDELLVLADYYGVADLRAYSELAVVDKLDKHNAVQTLFTVGSKFEKVKESALDFLANNMSELMLENKDPFSSFQYHPDCYSNLVELMRRKSKKA
ncbi:hypothetical protein BC939DRAFT_464462 [Gamsiella multidivaricata]|uniref:uncharacterized protein n=1 Tax=Gamsiella multidivaricata TaxID=101098 RepID=UPI002220782E|nr:uncharacterized protein BC939DRAFT_464462 [Gamsiella multidivaricata]KAG0352422.1 hypothetical protein BGZ54_002795 [Gamsiella multidivaricata]KAI7817905.1 hypothetical protein BC939DRAFT_464462 [Gamsiella multidivaricata]